MLELLAGKRAVFKTEGGSSPIGVVEYAGPRIAAGELWNVLDCRVGQLEVNEVESLEIMAYTAMHCVNLEGKERPNMADIVANLERALAFVEGSPGNQLSPTSNGRSLQLVASEQTDELESLANNILVNFLASSDPSKLVLDIIQHPLFQCKKGDNAVIIDGSHIILLEQLMRISPVVKPHVRDDAMKLALDLKAYISENTENSVAVLVFFLLLSIFGLVPSFDKDEVLKLFGFAAQHMIAVELFGTLGFADKISGSNNKRL